MMTTEIVNEVARLMRQRDLNVKDPKEVKVKKDIVEPQDEVDLSSAAESYASATTAGAPDYEKDQKMKVERLKSLVQSGNYKMDQDMVDTIAERIAKMFM